MNEKAKKILIRLFIVLVMFLTSFCDFNSVYFVLCVPLLVAIILFKNSLFIYAFLGMLLAAPLILGRTSVIILSTTVAITYFLSLILSVIKMKPLIRIGILTFFLGFALSWTHHFSSLLSPVTNFFIVPFITMITSCNFAKIVLELKSKENFSLRRNQLVFIGFMVITILFSLDNPVLGFRSNFILFLLLVYILIRVDSIIGVIACLLCVVYKIPSEDYARIALSLVSLIYIYKTIFSNKYLCSVIYLILSGIVLVWFGDFSYLKEIIPVSIIILFIPDTFISQLKKYIVEPQDYELKLYQKSYYKCLNRNKKIQKVLGSLEKKISSDNKIKKSNREIIMNTMQFLSNRLKEDDNIHIKDAILKELEYNKVDVIGLKINSDLLENYNIVLEVRDSEIEVEEMITILESYLNVRLKEENFYFDHIIYTYKYIITNDQKFKFNLCIKQRSKEGGLCGDSYLSFEMKNKKYILISDGMGHGIRASKESTEALNLLKNFIELGVNTSDAISCCNALMFDREKENFNTLDLFEYDVFDNQLYLYKNGSGTTYLKSAQGVKKIVSKNLPLGIVETIDVEKEIIDLDTKFIILTSDGFKKDYTEFLTNCRCKSAKSIAQEIISHEGDIIDDDQTIIVINVIKS